MSRQALLRFRREGDEYSWNRCEVRAIMEGLNMRCRKGCNAHVPKLSLEPGTVLLKPLATTRREGVIDERMLPQVLASQRELPTLLYGQAESSDSKTQLF